MRIRKCTSIFSQKRYYGQQTFYSIIVTQKCINTANAPTPGNYSHGRLIDLGNCFALHTAGQTGNDTVSGDVVEGGIGPQTAQTLKNVLAIVEAAGGTKDDIAKITVYLKDMKNDKAEFEKEYRKFFVENLPARAVLEVSEIPLVDENTIVEIEAVAYIQKN
jgi:2-iminobutanoate/2-iminopropanoate deaminase